MAERHASGLTSSELRLLPLLTTELSLNEIAQILEMPRDVVVALAQSIYMKLGPLGENASRLSSPQTASPSVSADLSSILPGSWPRFLRSRRRRSWNRRFDVNAGTRPAER